MSDAMEVYIGHLSSYDCHFTYQMVHNVTGHRTLCLTSSATMSDIKDVENIFEFKKRLLPLYKEYLDVI